MPPDHDSHNTHRQVTGRDLLLAFGIVAFMVALVVVANVWSRVAACVIAAVAFAAALLAFPSSSWSELAAIQKEREKTVGGKVLRWVEWLVLALGLLIAALEFAK